MRKLRKLALIAALSIIPAGSIYAGDGSPCEPIPGQTNTPPCAMAQRATEDDIAPNSPTALTQVNNTSEYSISELTLDLVKNLLALF